MQTQQQTTVETTQETEQKATGIILERHHLAAAAFCGDEGRYQCSGVNVKPDGTVEATNGHYAIRVPASKYPGCDFPEVEGKGAALSGPAVIPADTMKAAEKALPRKATIPILGCAFVGNGGPNVKITTTDLETPTVRAVAPIQGRFPDLDQVTPKIGPKALHIGMSVEYLRDIAAYASKVGAKGIELIIPDPKTAGETPVVFSVSLPDTQKATIVLMPMRLK